MIEPHKPGEPTIIDFAIVFFAIIAFALLCIFH